MLDQVGALVQEVMVELKVRWLLSSATNAKQASMLNQVHNPQLHEVLWGLQGASAFAKARRSNALAKDPSPRR